ncbi:MAG: hypothetical protein JSW28_03185 [Thermoplasmata archaeon]|nr:MAG: hypothetical protein JSW28_03185 [Thermoplasmata archaeon]
MTNVVRCSPRSGNLPEVPWVMGDPTSSYKWQVSVAGKGRKKKDRESKPDKLGNVVLNITLNVKRKEVKGGFFGKQVEEDFSPQTAAEVLLRAFHKAKYRDIQSVIADGKMLFDSEVDDRTFNEIIGDIKGGSKPSFSQIRIRAKHGTHSFGEIEIRKRHPKKEAPITVSFEGKIGQDILNAFLGYLKKHLPVKDVKY